MLIALVTLAAACSSGSSETVAGQDDLGHIHDLAFDDEENLLVATHSGLYRIEGADRAVLVGEVQHDLMAMTDGSNGTLIASGHPDLTRPEYEVEGKPPFLGLATSEDFGESWDVIGLLGEADFHALVVQDDGLFAAEGSGGRIWFLNSQQEWSQLGEVDARDLAINPADSSRQLAADYAESVWVSIDGARSWTELPEAPGLLEIEWLDPRTILGVDAAGSVWIAEEPLGDWTEIATGPADVETFYVDPTGDWWVTVVGGEISMSEDNGKSWSVVYSPPTDN